MASEFLFLWEDCTPKTGNTAASPEGLFLVHYMGALPGWGPSGRNSTRELHHTAMRIPSWFSCHVALVEKTISNENLYLFLIDCCTSSIFQILPAVVLERMTKLQALLLASLALIHSVTGQTIIVEGFEVGT